VVDGVGVGYEGDATVPDGAVTGRRYPGSGRRRRRRSTRGSGGMASQDRGRWERDGVVRGAAVVGVVAGFWGSNQVRPADWREWQVAEGWLLGQVGEAVAGSEGRREAYDRLPGCGGGRQRLSDEGFEVNECGFQG
jgi:hypothetical protein